MEVNSRASGGVGMTGLTTVNLPGLLLDALNGAFPDTPARVDRAVRVGRRDTFWEA
ncbi:MAG: ATP-grasp domain-containing protein, partial [Myxococcales bacterium]|nr:ATP-grasp domain-containing protein [Myxococcales bacterium]